MRGMRMWKRWAVFLLLFVVLAVGGSRTAQAEMLDMTKYNDDLLPSARCRTERPEIKFRLR